MKGEGDERIVSCNRAAARLFRIDPEALLLRPLGSLLVNYVARAVAVDLDADLLNDGFVRAWANIDEALEMVFAGAVRTTEDLEPRIAVFIRMDASRLREPAEAEISEARLLLALDSASVGEWDMDLRTNAVSGSRMFYVCFGYDVPPKYWSYDSFLEQVHPDDRDRVDAAFRLARAGSGNYDIEYRVVSRGGSAHWLWAKGRLYRDAAGTPIRVAGIVVNIDERKRTDERARIFALATDSTSDAIVIADARAVDFPIIFANAAFLRLTGYAEVDFVGKNCRFLQGSDRDQPAIEEIRTAMAEQRSTRVTLRNYRKDGSLFWNSLTISPVFDDSGILTHYVGVQTDVTIQRVQAEKLVQLASHDSLTELPNRRLLEERLDAALRHADASGRLVGVAFLDVDRLKRVNDSIGHAGGDDLLRTVANRLACAVEPQDVAARVGGDEFVVVMNELTDLADAERRARKLKEALSRPETIEGFEILPTASMGIAIYPTDGSAAIDLIRSADIAMYAAKRAGRGECRFFDPATMRPATDRILEETALENALKQGELMLEYQPIYEARSGRIASLEALIRWRHPEFGMIPPGEFIPLAEDSGLIIPIGEWVLNGICRQLHAWRHAGVELVPIAMNVSIAQLLRDDFLATFAAIVEGARLEPHWLVLELTESIVMDNAGTVLDRLRAKGFRISIDDFGTGFSSLSYLKRLSLDSLKIDKTFIDDVASDRALPRSVRQSSRWLTASGSSRSPRAWKPSNRRRSCAPSAATNCRVTIFPDPCVPRLWSNFSLGNAARQPDIRPSHNGGAAPVS